MKQVFLLTLLIFSICAKAQTHYDTAAGRWYVNIEAQTVPKYMRTADNISRLYVWLSDDNLGNSGTLSYQLRGRVVIDATTNVYPIVTSGSFPIAGAAYRSWNANDNQEAFDFIAGQDELQLKIVD